MYRIDYSNLQEAVKIIYRFMTIPTLTMPECTIWDDSGTPDTLTHRDIRFMTEKDFYKKITSAPFSSITCVASTDKADTRRVVLLMVSDKSIDYMALNFPSANGKINQAERELVQTLSSIHRPF